MPLTCTCSQSKKKCWGVTYHYSVGACSSTSSIHYCISIIAAEQGLLQSGGGVDVSAVNAKANRYKAMFNSWHAEREQMKRCIHFSSVKSGGGIIIHGDTSCDCRWRTVLLLHQKAAAAAADNVDGGGALLFSFLPVLMWTGAGETEGETRSQTARLVLNRARALSRISSRWLGEEGEHGRFIDQSTI